MKAVWIVSINKSAITACKNTIFRGYVSQALLWESIDYVYSIVFADYAE